MDSERQQATSEHISRAKILSVASEMREWKSGLDNH